MKKGFTLIEMLIVLVIIGILMTATMRFGSGRIVNLKAQSLKEQFVGYYNELYSQNLISSFRDGKKYQKLIIDFETGMSYQIDQESLIREPKFSSIKFIELMLDSQRIDKIYLNLTPYILWCPMVSSQWHTGDIFSFQLYVLENGKKYCFEIKTETCKLVETRCS